MGVWSETRHLLSEFCPCISVFHVFSYHTYFIHQIDVIAENATFLVNIGCRHYYLQNEVFNAAKMKSCVSM